MFSDFSKWLTLFNGVVDRLISFEFGFCHVYQSSSTASNQINRLDSLTVDSYCLCLSLMWNPFWFFSFIVTISSTAKRFRLLAGHFVCFEDTKSLNLLKWMIFLSHYIRALTGATASGLSFTRSLMCPGSALFQVHQLGICRLGSITAIYWRLTSPVLRFHLSVVSTANKGFGEAFESYERCLGALGIREGSLRTVDF